MKSRTFTVEVAWVPTKTVCVKAVFLEVSEIGWHLMLRVSWDTVVDRPTSYKAVVPETCKVYVPILVVLSVHTANDNLAALKEIYEGRAPPPASVPLYVTGPQDVMLIVQAGTGIVN